MISNMCQHMRKGTYHIGDQQRLGEAAHKLEEFSGK